MRGFRNMRKASREGFPKVTDPLEDWGKNALKVCG
jgi:hypothetical protein